MATNMKFHLRAVGIISAVVIVLYLMIGPKPQEQNVVHKPTDRFIRIGGATWGLSCNAQIEEARQARDAIPLAKDKDGKVIQNEPLNLVTPNNVLTFIKSACEGQMACEVKASDDTLGATVLASCYKQLNVNYRCSDTDRLVIANIDQGQSLKINCEPDASATEQHQP